jgi:arylformamidase
MQLFLGDGSYILVNEGIDCSLPLEGSEENVRAWYVSAPIIEPVRENGWVGSVAEGGSVNFRSIHFNPHGHGTHTECLGHITQEVHSVNRYLSLFHQRFEWMKMARLIE